jgi:hypothetical protein
MAMPFQIVGLPILAIISPPYTPEFSAPRYALSCQFTPPLIPPADAIASVT